jgi:hypothetical protein
VTGHTPTGVPYPDPTDAVADTWKALQALAAAVNNGSVVLSGGLVTMLPANMNGAGVILPTFPGMPKPMGAMACGAFPSSPAGNRFAYQCQVMDPPGVKLVQYSVTSPDVGKPVATPAVSASPVSVLTWAAAPPVPAPADGTGLVGDDWARVQAQGNAVNQRGLAARAQIVSLVAGTGGNLDSSGRFSVTFPDLLVTAAAACSPGNGFLYFNLTGLGSSTIGVQQYYVNWINGGLNPAGNVNCRAAVFAVGTPIDPPRT